MSGIPVTSVHLPDLSNWECVEYSDNPTDTDITSVVVETPDSSSSSSSNIDVSTIIFIIFSLLVVFIFLGIITRSPSTNT